MRARQYMLLFDLIKSNHDFQTVRRGPPLTPLEPSENQASRITDRSRSINNTNVRENTTEIVELW